MFRYSYLADPLYRAQFELGVKTVLVRFSSKALAAKKASIASEIPPPQYISSNDLLVASLWRAVARGMKGTLRDKDATVKVNVDSRGRNLGIPSTFTGGATFFAKPELETGVSPLDISLAKASLMIREVILAIDRSFIANTTAFVDTQSNAELTSSFLDANFLLNSTNWDSFGNLVQYDLGAGPAAALRLPPPGAERLSYVLPTSGPESGVDVGIGLTASQMEKFITDKELLEVGAEILGIFHS